MAEITVSRAPWARARRGVHELRKRFWSSSGWLDLRAELTALPEPPRARVPLVMELCDDGGFSGFKEEAERVSGHDLGQVRDRQQWLEGGVRRLYVAWSAGQPAYCQWLIEPSDLPTIVAAFPAGDFRPLGPDEVMLEGAYTFVRWRGRGAMADCMGQLLRIARDQGARYAVTCVGADNIPSLKGCARAGFEAERLRDVGWRFGRVRTHNRSGDEAPAWREIT